MTKKKSDKEVTEYIPTFANWHEDSLALPTDSALWMVAVSELVNTGIWDGNIYTDKELKKLKLNVYDKGVFKNVINMTYL